MMAALEPWRAAAGAMLLAMTLGYLLSQGDLRLVGPPTAPVQGYLAGKLCGRLPDGRTVGALVDLRIEDLALSQVFKTGWPAYVSVKLWGKLNNSEIGESLGLDSRAVVKMSGGGFETCYPGDRDIEVARFHVRLHPRTEDELMDGGEVGALGRGVDVIVGQIGYTLRLTDGDGREVWRLDARPPLFEGSWVDYSPGYDFTTWSWRRWGWFLVPDLQPGNYTLVVVVIDLLTNLTARATRPVEVAPGEDPRSVFRPEPIGIEGGKAARCGFLRQAALLGWGMCWTSEGMLWDVQVGLTGDPRPAWAWRATLISMAEGRPRVVFASMWILSDEGRASRWMLSLHQRGSEYVEELRGLGSEAVILRDPRSTFKDPETGEVVTTGASVELVFRRGNVVVSLYSEEFNLSPQAPARGICSLRVDRAVETALPYDAELLALAEAMDSALSKTAGSGG